jgi:hypothetical protein
MTFAFIVSADGRASLKMFPAQLKKRGGDALLQVVRFSTIEELWRYPSTGRQSP